MDRVVVVRQLGGIGDVLSMSCVYRGLKEKYPNKTITLITAKIYLGAALLDIAEHNPFIDEIFCYEPFEGTTENTKRVWHREFGNSPSIDDGSDPLIRDAYEVIDLNTACVDYEWAVQPNITKPRYQIWAEKANVWPLKDTSPAYVITEGEQEKADTYLKKYEGQTLIGVGISAFDRKRAMGVGHLHTICHQLQERGYTPITFDPTFTFPDVEYKIGYRISEVMPIINRLKAMITVDSGLLHMAGAVKTPVIGLFGPTDPSMRMNTYIGSAIDSRKLMACAPCWYRYSCLSSLDENEHYKCMKRIPIDVVVEETVRWASGSHKLLQPLVP